MVRTGFWSQDVTNGCCHYIDGNAHTEERMGNMLEAMKLLGLEAWCILSGSLQVRD